MKEHNPEDLEFVRIFTPHHIPRYLVEQIKHRDYEVDEFYVYLDAIGLRQTKEGPALNPFCHMYVLIDSNKIAQGFLWMTIDPLTKDLIIHNFSIDPKYWCKGKAIEKLTGFLKTLLNKIHIKKVYWTTNCPKACERYGFKASKFTLMEYSHGKSNGRIQKGSDSDSNSSTTSSIQPSIGESGPTSDADVQHDLAASDC